MTKHRSLRFLIILLVAGQVGVHRAPELAMEAPARLPVVAGGSEAVRQVDLPPPADAWAYDSRAGSDGYLVFEALSALRSPAVPALTIDGAESAPAADHGGLERAPAGDSTQIVGADAELAAAIRQAIARFESAGLTLPELSIHAHPTSAGCRGNCGLYTTGESGGRVDLCVRGQHTILHELAHAWEHHNVDDATRQRFLTHSGLEVWNDPETDWDERGIEAAAQVIAWGLLDIPITNADRFENQLDQFELLTGLESPRL